MGQSVFKKVISASIVALGAIAVSLPAQAGTLINGWNYANDDQLYDGSGGLSGNANFGPASRYDFYGMGFKQVGNEIFVGINTSYKAGTNGVINNVGYGDLFLDFGYDSGSNFQFQNAQGALLGIRFAPNDMNPSSNLNGVYTGVKGKSVAGSNQGYTNLKTYNDKVKADNDNGNANSRFGDLLWTDPYFAAYTPGSTSIPNVINTGTFANNSVRSLTPAQLAAQLFPTTVNLASNNKYVYGFAFTLPDQYRGMSFLATLGFECSNDTISAYVPRPVPVPPAVAGVLVAGALGGWRAAKRKKTLNAVEA
ncbi:XDD3 family exosortase-dependent surface protein [Pseudanabaena mucicola]|uniref:PEP-CTERM sorting domain-containing protein n=1 Tax=Pseudanabaena mucicola FACHB-723 TaxID=2692860 RepID=A0ABR7ZYH8_9CYAN|nr:XDD3 family exosortase-dependent surface protein [Pseudanabaena mucicola]MBD2188311.1 hypothetical protein [Pseudanabaena mucicola FACHB-723]